MTDNGVIPDGAGAVWRMVGLAARAGKAAAGAEAAGQALRRHKAFLILLATDAAANTGQKLIGQCTRAKVPVRQFGRKDELGYWTGHEVSAVVALLDAGFAGRIDQLISALGNQAENGRLHEK